MAQVTVGMTTMASDNPAHWAEAPRALGPNVTLLEEPVDLRTMSADSFDQAHGRLKVACQRLASRGASGIMIGGTSFTFYRGHDFHRQLLRDMSEATQRPVSSTSRAMLDALEAVGARKLAILTAYSDEVNERLRTFLAEAGYETLRLEGMGITAISEVEAIPPEQTSAMAKGVFERSPEADCLVISCGGLRTLDIVAPLEADINVPVITSYSATLWGLSCLARTKPESGFGRLMDGQLVAV